MSNINIYPFTRKIVLEQKSQQEQNALLANVNKNVNPLVTPADYTPVIVTNQPVAGVTDQLRTMKPSISVIEETYAPVTPTVEKEVKTSGKPQPLIGTIIATALVVTAGYFLYKRLYTGK
jgi:hypothetical protein